MSKDLWSMEVGDNILMEEGEVGKVVDISFVRKPDPFVIVEDNAGDRWEIRGNMHGDTEWEILK